MSAKKPPIRPHQRPLKGDQVDKAIELSKDSPVVVQGKNTGFDVYVRLSDCTIQYDAKTPLCRKSFLQRGVILCLQCAPFS